MTPSADITIRPAVEADFESVTSLYRESFSLHSKAHPESYKDSIEYPIKRGNFINILEDDDEAMYIAEINSIVIGFINASVEEENETRLFPAFRRVSVDDICVTEKYRRQGAGSMLLKKIEQWATEKKINELSVIVYKFNTPALHLYEKLGYTPSTVRMNKKLS